jgi:hypothetical protein
MHRVRMMENDWTRGQGIGFSVMRVDDALHIGHGGGYPGYTTHTRIQLDDEVGVIVLTNTNDSSPRQISAQLMKTVGQAVIETKAESAEDVPWDPAWTRFAGLYRSAWGDVHVVPMTEKLVLLYASDNEIDPEVFLKPIGDDQFLMMAPGGGGPVGEVVRFVEEGNRVTRMITGDSYAWRVEK